MLLVRNRRSCYFCLTVLCGCFIFRLICQQVVEYDQDEDPVLVLAAESKTATQGWMSYLRTAFWNHTVARPEQQLGMGEYLNFGLSKHEWKDKNFAKSSIVRK